MEYTYGCACGEITSTVRADFVECLKCGTRAKRIRRIGVIKSSLKQTGGWNPQVGEYVANEREFRDALARGKEREEAELGREVKLVTHDARDTEAAAELHGETVEKREADMEPTRRRAWEMAKT